MQESGPSQRVAQRRLKKPATPRRRDSLSKECIFEFGYLQKQISAAIRARRLRSRLAASGCVSLFGVDPLQRAAHLSHIYNRIPRPLPATRSSISMELFALLLYAI